MRTLIAVIVVAVLAVGAYLLFGTPSATEPATRFVTVAVEKGKLRAEITCTGTLRPLVEVIVGSQVSGTIKKLYADFESRVEKGQLIALIDPGLFEAKAAQARADLLAAQANLAKSEVTLRNEERDFKRQEGLIGKGSISQSEFDKAKTEFEAAQAQVEVDRARVAQAEAKQREAKLQLEYTRIVAPVSGIVTSRNMDEGQTVAASFQAPQIFKIAEDLTRMQVHTNVDEADIGRVKVGQNAIFTVPAFPDEPFDAKVVQIRNEPTVEQNVVTYNVVLDVKNEDLRLRPGMTANVRILRAEVHDALMIPDQALRFTPTAKLMKTLQLPKLAALRKGERRVWELQNGDRIRPVIVKTGIFGTDRVQVHSDILKPGDLLVVEAATKKKRRPRLRGIRF